MQRNRFSEGDAVDIVKKYGLNDVIVSSHRVEFSPSSCYRTEELGEQACEDVVVMHKMRGDGVNLLRQSILRGFASPSRFIVHSFSSIQPASDNEYAFFAALLLADKIRNMVVEVSRKSKWKLIYSDLKLQNVLWEQADDKTLHVRLGDLGAFMKTKDGLSSMTCT